MINLIPPDGRRTLKREYILRVSATVAILLGCVLILLTVALVPTYVLVQAQINAYELEEGLESDEESAYKAMEQEIKQVQDVLARLKAPAPFVLPSMVIEEVTKQTPNGVTYKTFYTQENKGAVHTIQVQGNATTREVLAELKSTLEGSSMFGKVELPIADLARDADLPFAITLTLKGKK